MVGGLIWLGGIWQWLAVGPAALLFLIVFFFRDPSRRIPTDPAAIVAPADGTIVDVTPLEHYDFLGGPAVRVGIFLSIFNVHINRAPFAGRVVEMHYQPGEFLNAMRPESQVCGAANLGHAGPPDRLRARTGTDGPSRREVWYD